MKHLMIVLALVVVGCGGRQVALEDRGVALVIVNKANDTSADPSDLREIFLGRQRHWDNGIDALVVYLEANLPHRAAVLERIVRLDASSYERSVTSQMYRTSWRGPFRVSSDDEVIRAVASTKGGVGVIAPASFTAEAGTRVRVLMQL